MKSALVLIAATLCLPAATAWAGADYSKDIVRKFEPRSVEKLELQNLAGRLLVEEASGDELELRATVHADAYDKMDARDVAQLLELKIERDGGAIAVMAVYPVDRYSRLRYGAAEGGFFSGSTQTRVDGRKVRISMGRKGDGLPLWVDFHLRVPAGVDCSLRNLVGDVKLEGLHGDVKLDCASAEVDVDRHDGRLLVDSGSGDIRVVDMRGALTLDTGSGDIKVENLEGDFSGDTGSGDILLRQARGEAFHADTGSGDVILKDAAYPQMGIDTGSGDVEVASLLAELRRWQVDTGSGDVVFSLPALGASFRLEVDTSNGDVQCAFDSRDVQLHRGKIRSLTVGTGEGLIIVDTGSGDISLLQRK